MCNCISATLHIVCPPASEDASLAFFILLNKVLATIILHFNISNLFILWLHFEDVCFLYCNNTAYPVTNLHSYVACGYLTVVHQGSIYRSCIDHCYQILLNLILHLICTCTPIRLFQDSHRFNFFNGSYEGDGSGMNHSMDPLTWSMSMMGPLKEL